MARIGTVCPVFVSVIGPFNFMSLFFSSGENAVLVGCPVSGLIGYGTYGMIWSWEFDASPFGLSVVKTSRDDTGSKPTLPVMHI